MNLIEKLEPAILIFAIIIGLILSDIKILSNNIILMHNVVWYISRSSSQKLKKKF